MSTRVTKHKKFTYWTEKDKQRAISVYKSLGVFTKTAELTGIPYDTLMNWKEQEWWTEALLAAKREDTVQLEEASTEIAKKAGDVLRDRLEYGDSVLTRDGELVKKPVAARDAAIILGISLQQRKNLQEEPVRIAQLGMEERLLKLQQQFARLADNRQIEGKLVEEEENEPQNADSVFGVKNEIIEANTGSD